MNFLVSLFLEISITIGLGGGVSLVTDLKLIVSSVVVDALSVVLSEIGEMMRGPMGSDYKVSLRCIWYCGETVPTNGPITSWWQQKQTMLLASSITLWCFEHVVEVQMNLGNQFFLEPTISWLANFLLFCIASYHIVCAHTQDVGIKMYN